MNNIKNTKQTAKHTAGEWTINIINQPMGNHKTNREILYKINQEKMPIDIHPDEESYANAKRIVDCVNACQGIDNPKEAIESMKELRSLYWSMQKQHEQDLKDLNKKTGKIDKQEKTKEALQLAIEALQEHKDESTLPRIKELLKGTDYETL